MAINAPIFLLSDFRTGSTVLRFSLDAHPEICCPAELNMTEICQEVFRFVELTTDDGISSSGDLIRMRLNNVRQIINDQMDAYCVRKRKRRWCEKSPNNASRLNLIGTVFPDAQYICLYRYAPDQVQSFLEWADIEQRLERYLPRNGGDLVCAAIDRWCSQVEKLLAFEHLHRSRAYRICYEELVTSPEQQLASLMKFLQVEQVTGLAVAGFEVKHDRGPADHKIALTGNVARDRIGKGQAIDFAAAPIGLRNRVSRLLRCLGYPPLPGVVG